MLRIDSEDEASSTPAKSFTYPAGLSCLIGSAQSMVARQTSAQTHVIACQILLGAIRSSIICRRMTLQICNNCRFSRVLLHHCNMQWRNITFDGGCDKLRRYVAKDRINALPVQCAACRC